jgi:hypothetical protein
VTEPARPPAEEPAGHPGAPDPARGGPSEPSGWERPPQPAWNPGAPAPSSPGWASGPTSGPTGAPGLPPGWGAPSGPVQGWGPTSGPAPGWGAPPAPRVQPPTDERRLPPKRVEAVPGTPFGVVHLDVPPVTSGLAVGALLAGIASILVSLLVICFGVVGANNGGVWASGAFAVLGVLSGAGAIVAGLLAQRQMRRPAAPPAVRFTGRGLAVAAISCGAAGVLLSLLGLGLALVISLT